MTDTPSLWPSEPRAPSHPAEPMLTIEQLADRLRISVSTARRRVKDGTIRTIRLGRLVRVDPAEIARLAEAEAEV